MSKLKLLIAFALGYVAGAAAGRQRYESIKSGAQKVASDPRVQSAAKKVGTTVAEQAPVVAEAVKEKTTAAASAVADKVSGSDDEHAQPPAAPTGTPLS